MQVVRPFTSMRARILILFLAAIGEVGWRAGAQNQATNLIYFGNKPYDRARLELFLSAYTYRANESAWGKQRLQYYSILPDGGPVPPPVPGLRVIPQIGDRLDRVGAVGIYETAPFYSKAEIEFEHKQPNVIAIIGNARLKAFRLGNFILPDVAGIKCATAYNYKGRAVEFYDVGSDRPVEFPPPPAPTSTTPPTTTNAAAVGSRVQVARAAALRFNQKQADQGDAFGQLRMGERYRDGDGVEKDLVKAREMFQKAAAQGNQEAAAALAKLPPQ